MLPTLPTIEDFRARFADAGLAPVDLNGDGAGFGAMCPACPGTLRVFVDGNGRIEYDCPSGCGRDQITHGIEFMTSSPGGFAERERSSWEPVDLAAILNGSQHDPAPETLARADGVCLLYAGRIHAVSAEPESGKGWLALHACAEQLAAGEHVVYIDYEDTAVNIVARLIALTVDPDAIRSRLHYVRPEDPVTPEAVAALAELQPALVVIDGVTEALAMEGLDMASNQDVAGFYKRLARPFARAGAAVLLIDHVVKDREARGRYAIGAQHKLAGVDVAYKLDVAQPFGRGREGLVKITVTKDRPGHVRQHAADRERIAMMRLTSTGGGSVTVTLEPPEGASVAFRPTVLMERISRAVYEAPGLSIRGLREAVKGNNEAKSLALELLVNEGFVDARRDGQAVKHYPLHEYREAEDVPTVPNRAQTVPKAHVPTVPPPLQGGHEGAPTRNHPTVPNADDDAQARLDDLATRHSQAA